MDAEGDLGFVGDGCGGVELETAGAFEAGHLLEAAVAADADCVRGPRRLKREAGANLDDSARQGGGLGELIGLERLAEEPLEGGHLVVCERGGDLDVEALLGGDGVDDSADRGLGVRLARKRRRRLIGEEGTAEQLKHGAGAGGGAVGGRVGRHRAGGDRRAAGRTRLAGGRVCGRGRGVDVGRTDTSKT